MTAKQALILSVTALGAFLVVTLDFWPAFIGGWVALVIIAWALMPEPQLTESTPHD